MAPPCVGMVATGVVVVDQIEGHAFPEQRTAKVTMNDGAFRTIGESGPARHDCSRGNNSHRSAKYHFQWNCVSIKMTPIAAPDRGDPTYERSISPSRGAKSQPFPAE